MAPPVAEEVVVAEEAGEADIATLEVSSAKVASIKFVEELHAESVNISVNSYLCYSRVTRNYRTRGVSRICSTFLR